MGRKVYRLLSINDAMSLRTRLLSREGGEDTYTVNVDEGIDGLRSKLSWMIKEGMTFQNAVFTTHGNRGAIHFGAEGRDLAAIRVAARLLGGRIGVGDVFRDHPHPPGLGAQAGGGNPHRADEIA